MLRAGLTGNMGSGKSTVASIFGCLGVPLYRADDAAKRMYLRPEVLRQAVAMTSDSILGADGRVDRRALAFQVFSDPGKLKRLNALIHPLVQDDFANWLKSYPQASYVIHEAAILYESGYAKEFDCVIHVSCPEESAIARIVKRDSLSRNEILLRMRHQIPDREKCELADFVILNDGSTLVIPQVLGIHQELSERSA